MRALAVLIASLLGAAAAGALFLMHSLYMPLRFQEVVLLTVKYASLPLFIGAVVLERVLAKLRFGVMTRSLSVLPLAAACLCGVAAYLVFKNGDEDSSQMMVHRGKVLEKIAGGGMLHGFQVRMDSWRDKGETELFFVSERDFRAIVPNETFGTIYTRKGSLGVEWISSSGSFLDESGPPAPLKRPGVPQAQPVKAPTASGTAATLGSVLLSRRE